MIVGHLPAGYITTKLLFNHFKSLSISYKAFMFFGIFGALFPDVDMIYFYLIDHRQHHHHTYFTHFPVVWLSLLIASVLWLCFSSERKKSALAVIFSLGGFVHMLLDTIVGDIWWFSPFIDKPFSLATVPAIYKPWWLNFLLHWSFGIEILVGCWAIYLLKISPSHHSNRTTRVRTRVS